MIVTPHLGASLQSLRFMLLQSSFMLQRDIFSTVINYDHNIFRAEATKKYIVLMYDNLSTSQISALIKHKLVSFICWKIFYNIAFLFLVNFLASLMVVIYDHSLFTVEVTKKYIVLMYDHLSASQSLTLIERKLVSVIC